MKSFLISIAILLSIPVVAQKAIYSYSNDSSRVEIIPKIDRERLAFEDSIDAKIGAPMRLAFLHPLELDIAKKGDWQIFDDGSTSCLMEISTPNSYGVIVRFKDLYIPKDAQLLVYGSNPKIDSWIYTNEETKEGGRYSVEVLSGENIFLEYIAPKNITEAPRLILEEVGYKYRYTQPSFVVEDTQLATRNRINVAGNECMSNVNCPDYFQFRNQKRGVVKLQIVRNGLVYLCSGSLVNNTMQDKTPYVLTAQHCFGAEGENTTAEIDKTVFIFHYEFPNCGNQEAVPEQVKIVGAKLITESPIRGGTDMTLLKITKSLPENMNVYYNGWSLNKNPDAVQFGVAIHHPEGDVKKISPLGSKLQIGTWRANSYSGALNAHWIAKYDNSATAGGSSGSPLFDQQGLIIGTLTGGSSRCGTPNGLDFFGMMSAHWKASENAQNDLSNFLDPKNSGRLSMPGMDGTDTPTAGYKEKDILYCFWPDAASKNNLVVALKDETDSFNSIYVYDINGDTVFYDSDLNNASSYTYTVKAQNWSSKLYIVRVTTKSGKKASYKIIR